MLTAGLAGHGYDAGLLDLSLEFYHRVLTAEPFERRVQTAVNSLLDAPNGYDPHAHRTAAGNLHHALKRYGEQYPGWTLTLMDISPPCSLWSPVALAAELEAHPSPFEDLWQECLVPELERSRPNKVLISLAYLSQLPAAIDLARFLESQGVEPIVGGSLPSSLANTGLGLEALQQIFSRVELGDGSSLLKGGGEGNSLLTRLAWPKLLSNRPYLSARPIVPLPLSTGCYWNRCLFCPDREKPFVPVPEAAIANMLGGMPDEISSRRPVVHLLDSAIAPAHLKRFLPLARTHSVAFYGFARPTRHLLRDDLIGRAADSGCLMLQLGVEGASGPLLDRYDKGLDPAEAERVLCAAAEAGVRTYLYLLFGLPGETEADRESTLEMIARCEGKVDFLNLSIFNLPRYSELTERAVEFGLELGEFPEDAQLQLYRPFTVNGEVPRGAARRFLSRRFKNHPQIRPALLRTPRWLRAAHLALMNIEGRRS